MKTKDYFLTLIPVVGAMAYVQEILPKLGTRAYRTFWYWFMLVWHITCVIIPSILLHKLS